MATALKDRESPLSIQDWLMLPIDVRKLSPHQYPIRNRQDIGTPPVPAVQVITREIDMAPPGSAYPLMFVRPDRAQPIGEFHRILQEVCARTYQYAPAVNQYYRPLDLNLRVPTRFIIRLSDRWNWRFASNALGLTLSEFQNSADMDKYADLRHVSDSGVVQNLPFHNHEEFCRIIYFDADPVSASFNHPFNLNVEMVYPDGDNGPNTLPIIIDPDVRHPGGSGS